MDLPKQTLALARANSEPVVREKVDREFDPLAQSEEDGLYMEQKTESLTLRATDESRVAAAMSEAAKTKKTGSIFSISIELSSAGTLGLGVKVLKSSILVVSMLKRVNGSLGPGEMAGSRLGDIVIGVNFKPCRDGVRSLMAEIRTVYEAGARQVQLQCWRCHQLCTEQVPGSLFPRADDVFVKGYCLFRSKVFSDWERWNFVEIMLEYMKQELHFRVESSGDILATKNSYPGVRAIHNQVLDLERNILRAKGLRTALCVRIVHTSFVQDAVVYVLRVEDVESGLQWNVRKRYRDFYALHGDLLKMSPHTKSIAFPKKRLVSLRTSTKVIEERIVALEQFVRMAVHQLTHFSAVDITATQSLRRVQEFLDVGTFIDCVHPPPLDDQRYLELMVYRHLNDFNSLSCQQCIRFVDSVNLDALVKDGPLGYQPVLDLLSQALIEVEEYTLQQFGQQMTHVLSDRRPGANQDKIRQFVRRCVRRQVEAAVYLPLRRAVFRIVYSFVATKAQKLQQAMKTLKPAPPSVFFVSSVVTRAENLPGAVQAFRDLVGAFLPADQGHALMKAAGAVMELHSECSRASKRVALSVATSDSPVPPNSDATSASDKGFELKATSNKLLTPVSPTRAAATASASGAAAASVADIPRSRSLSDLEEMAAVTSDMLNKAVLADPAGTIFSAAENVLTEKTDYDDGQMDAAAVAVTAGDADVEAENSPTFFGEKNAANYSGVDVRRRSASRGEQTIPSRLFDDSATKHAADKPAREILLEGLLRASGSSESSALRTSNPNAAEEPPGSGGSRSRSSSAGGNDSERDGSERRRRRLSHPVPVSVDETPLAGMGGGEEDLEDRVEDAGDYADDICIRGEEGAVEEGAEDIVRAGSNQDDRTGISGDGGEGAASAGAFYEASKNYTVVSADDFLPMFTYVIVQADLPQMMLVKELMSTLVDNEELYGECGYYMATLEAALQHVINLADEYSTTLKQNEGTNAPVWNEV